jgi:hypothetical protein
LEWLRVFKHCRELVTEKEADAWFGVRPTMVAALKKKAGGGESGQVGGVAEGRCRVRLRWPVASKRLSVHGLLEASCGASGGTDEM